MSVPASLFEGGQRQDVAGVLDADGRLFPRRPSDRVGDQTAEIAQAEFEVADADRRGEQHAPAALRFMREQDRRSDFIA